MEETIWEKQMLFVVCGVVNWIYLAQVRVQFRAVANAVMSVWIL
jgi:hypothetical protein